MMLLYEGKDNMFEVYLFHSIDLTIFTYHFIYLYRWGALKMFFQLRNETRSRIIGKGI